MEIELNTVTYAKEQKYTLSRLLFLIILTIISFILIHISDNQRQIHFFILEVMLAGLSIFSLLHYAFIRKYPLALHKTRKFILIFLDLLVLTVSIVIMGSSGLFLLPLYILIVMESGMRFGFIYFYFSIILSSLAWLTLVTYSEYWQTHSDTVAIFAITTFLIPLMYMKQMMNMHEKHEILHETLQSTEHAANYDALTKLPNRKYYNSFMKELLQEKSFFALLFIDLNKFKIINDTHGHEVGDRVLKEVSQRLSKSIDEEDMLARLGGDEFVIITKRKKAFLPKFISNLEQTTIGNHRVGNVEILIELSIGVSLFPDDSKSETFLRKYADEAMYCAKKRKDTYHVFYEEIKPTIESSENFS